MVSNPLQEVELTEFGERNDILLLNDNHNIDTTNKEHVSLLSNSDNLLDSGTTHATDHEDSLRISRTNISFDDKIKILQHSRRLLYVSHLLAQFSEVSWQFCLTIFLAALTNYQSLLLVSTYGLVTGLAVTLLGSTTGSLVDTTNRLVAARCFIWMENISVIMATLCCFWLLSNKKNQHATSMLLEDTAPTTETNQQSSSILLSLGAPTDMSSILLIIAIHLLGAAARVLDEGFLVAMERDWVVVMSRFVTTNDSIPDNDISPSKQQAGTAPLTITKNFNSRSWLSETNVAMKQIDLSCKVLAPAVAGFCIALVDNRASSSSETIHQEHDNDMSNGSQFQYAALAVGAINVLSLIVEYYCTTVIYQSIPDLAFLKQSKEHANDKAEEDLDQNSIQGLPTGPATAPLTGSSWRASLPYGARVYLEQKTCLAGIGLAMLYLNALTFDAIFTAYLVWRGIRLETIGIWRGVSSAIGLLGTCVYHWSVKRMTLEMTGMWSIVYEFLCLSLSYGSLFVDDSHVSLVMLITGVCASRVGLWVFDITVTQMMQEYVPDGIRGVVGGVQQSNNAFFNLLSYALGILFPDPGHFYVYVAAGYASVGIAMLLYGWGTYGHWCIRGDTKIIYG